MAYITRDIEFELVQWAKAPEIKPLLIRGARQVGKSSVIRHFGKQFKHYVEVNFESDLDAKSIFSGNLNPQRICEQLSILYNKPIIAGDTLLFFDEIQACVPAISSLRFFYEHYPQLHVIAAGSLLEFALAELSSFGVGRVRSMFLYPFSFGEFLTAMNEQALRIAIHEASPQHKLQDAIHQKAIDLYKRFLILGGMPKVVSAYCESFDMLRCQRILDDLVISYDDDFVKYKKRASISILRMVLKSVVEQNGHKFVYASTNPDLNRLQVKEALELLVLAGLIIPITHTSANGIPLGAEMNLKKRKYILFDTGIFQRMLGLNIADVLIKNDFQSVNKGSIAELNVGLELLKSGSCYQRQALYYWHRESNNSNAEVDYLVQRGQVVLPIEVKAGTKGSMQSLRLFMEEKKVSTGIRVSLEHFSNFDNIEVYPLYAVKNIVSDVP